MGADEYTYFEDLKVGQKFTSGPLLVTTDGIIDFAKQFDPQFFHTDPIAAQDSLFGEHVASGWHTAAMSMRLIIEATPKMKGGMIGRQVEKMSWPRPVRPGDELSYEAEILDLRASDKNPALGIMRVKNTTRNQDGKTVLEMETVVFVPRRIAA